MIDPRIKKSVSLALNAILDRKGENTIGLNFENVESYTDFILITSASNPRQVKAIADHVQDEIRRGRGLHPLGVEGYDNATWVLVDYGDVVIHVFMEDVRQIYHIEDMWPHVRALSVAQIKNLIGEGVKKTTPIKKTRKPTKKSPATGKVKKTASRKSAAKNSSKAKKPAKKLRKK